MEQIAALRAEWFAQLADAIEGAQTLAWQLGTRDVTSIQARELYGRLEAVRVELESLRGMRALPRTMTDPDWPQALGWGRDPAGIGD